MTNLTYILADGTVTASYSKALADGRPFKRHFEEVREATIDEARREKYLAKFGFSGREDR